MSQKEGLEPSKTKPGLIDYVSSLHGTPPKVENKEKNEKANNIFGPDARFTGLIDYEQSNSYTTIEVYARKIKEAYYVGSCSDPRRPNSFEEAKAAKSGRRDITKQLQNSIRNALASGAPPTAIDCFGDYKNDCNKSLIYTGSYKWWDDDKYGLGPEVCPGEYQYIWIKCSNNKTFKVNWGQKIDLEECSAVPTPAPEPGSFGGVCHTNFNGLNGESKIKWEEKCSHITDADKCNHAARPHHILNYDLSLNPCKWADIVITGSGRSRGIGPEAGKVYLTREEVLNHKGKGQTQVGCFTLDNSPVWKKALKGGSGWFSEGDCEVDSIKFPADMEVKGFRPTGSWSNNVCNDKNIQGYSIKSGDSSPMIHNSKTKTGGYGGGGGGAKWGPCAFLFSANPDIVKAPAPKPAPCATAPIKRDKGWKGKCPKTFPCKWMPLQDSVNPNDLHDIALPSTYEHCMGAVQYYMKKGRNVRTAFDMVK